MSSRSVSHQDIENAFSDIREFMDLGRNSKMNERTQMRAYQLISPLADGKAAHTFSNRPKALESLLELAPEIEAYTNQARDSLLGGWVEILERIDWECMMNAYGETGELSPKISYTSQRLTKFILARVSATPAKSQRISRYRTSLWRSLAIFAKIAPSIEVKEAAIKVALNKSYSTGEREQAVACFLLFWDSDDPEYMKGIERLQEAPPSRSALVSILDYKVEEEGLDPFSALIQVEDWEDDD